MAKAALPHLAKGSAIINTTSVTAYRGSPHLIDYASTKGAIVSFTRSLSQALVEKGSELTGLRRAYLDAVDSGHVSGERCRQVWLGRTDGPCRRA